MFARSLGTHLCSPDVTPGCEWVLDGLGLATRKWDGTCCLHRNGIWFKRRTVERGKSLPDNFTLEDVDTAGKRYGWMPVNEEDQWHQKAISRWERGVGPMFPAMSGTFELIGPKVNNNPEGWMEHMLIRHGAVVVSGMSYTPLTFEKIESLLYMEPIEGIVFYHVDGRMAKIKRTDFGFEWPVRGEA